MPKRANNAAWTVRLGAMPKHGSNAAWNVSNVVSQAFREPINRKSREIPNTTDRFIRTLTISGRTARHSAIRVGLPTHAHKASHNETLTTPSN